MNRWDNDNHYTGEIGLLVFKLQPTKTFEKGSIFSEKKWLQWNKLVYGWNNASFHTKHSLCLEFRKQLVSNTWLSLALKSLTLFFLSQGFALGNSPDAVCSCQWGNPRSLWHGCKGNYRFVNDEVFIYSFKFHLSCLLRLFLLSSRGGPGC